VASSQRTRTGSWCDKRVMAGLYSVGVSPADGSIWGTSLGFPGYVVRVNPGSDPTHTALAEIYEPPLPGYGPRGGDIDRNGVFWVSLSSGHLGSFDRRKCKGPLNGPGATGKHCPEGWTLYPFPGPQFQNVKDPGSAEASYYTWVDQFDTFGLGKNVPIATGNLNGSMRALVEGEVRQPVRSVPNEFFRQMGGWTHRRSESRLERQGLMGNILNPQRISSRNRQSTTSKVLKFQLRPDPLAR
jgi:hypothetical protein